MFLVLSLHLHLLDCLFYVFFFFFHAEDGIRDLTVTGVQTCALPISDAFTGRIVTSVFFPRVCVRTNTLGSLIPERWLMRMPPTFTPAQVTFGSQNSVIDRKSVV